MTTPERLKARQIREGVVLILLAIFTILQAVYFNLEDRESRKCFQDNFVELVHALEVRAEASELETAATKDIWLTYAEAAGLIKDDPTKPVPPRDEERLQRQLVTELLDYQQIVKKIEKDRRDNPVPPYPVGTCTDE